MSYGVFRLNKCYSGPKVFIISAEEHAYFIREETEWYIRDDFGNETSVFSGDEYIYRVGSIRKLLTESGTAHDSASVILEGGEDS